MPRIDPILAEMPKVVSEFDIINRYFKKQCVSRQQIIKGIGDDAAVHDVSQHRTQLIAMDTLVAGVHFSTECNAYDIAYKALAVNLSDLAAMGATPAWFTLALTLPQSSRLTNWLEDFSRGLFTLAEQFQLELIGGDTTCGPLTVTIQIAGYNDENTILYRSGAQVNDSIYVSGTLGDAGAGLKIKQNKLVCDVDNASVLKHRLHQPTARVKLGLSINTLASACIDVSDGLLADLNHILDSSQVGATIYVENLPLSNSLRASVDIMDAYQLALSSGDDYELCFCVAPQNKHKIEKLSQCLSLPLSCIGQITQTSGLRCTLNNDTYDISHTGYEHFS